MRFLVLVLSVALMMHASPSSAGGGAHVVDDAEVEAPGTCHLEAWTHFGRDGRTFSLAPGCALRSLPGLELGGFIDHYRGKGGRQTLFGPVAKVVLRPIDPGVGLALVAETAFDFEGEGLDSVSLILPLSWDATSRVRVNGNLGAIWLGDGSSRSTFAGIQMEYSVSEELSLMAETYRTTNDQGQQFQVGLRWFPWRDLGLDFLTSNRGATVGIMLVR